MGSQAAAGASVSIRSLSKSYGDFIAVASMSFDIAGGEFIALLGPSGSGKSTMLMSIAGFEAPTSGEILLDGSNITALPPHKRNIGVVFQKYALFPHLTAAENIAYPLRRRLLPHHEIEREVARALAMVNLDGFAGRFPAQLSGGQQQRVALARALVFRPRLLLMDEPLGALDRKLRQQMQMELKLLHRELGTTIIMVTHDQEEALSMADRVVVMNAGRVEQIGAPAELYDAPSSAFVADFIGETNLLPIRILRRTDCAAVVTVAGIDEPIEVPISQCLTSREEGILSIRPEHIQPVDREGFSVTEIERAFGGSMTSVLLDLDGRKITARVSSNLLRGGARVSRVSFPSEHCRVYENSL